MEKKKKVVFSRYAEKQIAERNLPVTLIKKVLWSHDQLLADGSSERKIAKYFRKGQ